MRKALRCTPIVTTSHFVDLRLLVHKLRKWSHSFGTPFIMYGDVFCHVDEFTYSLLLHSLETSILGWNEEHRKYSCFLLYAQQTVHANCLFFFLALSYGGGGALLKWGAYWWCTIELAFLSFVSLELRIFCLFCRLRFNTNEWSCLNHNYYEMLSMLVYRVRPIN